MRPTDQYGPSIFAETTLAGEWPRLARLCTRLSGSREAAEDLTQEALSEGSNPLAPRERDVLAASLFGASLAEIAARLVLSKGTVHNHLTTAMQ